MAGRRERRHCFFFVVDFRFKLRGIAASNFIAIILAADSLA